MLHCEGMWSRVLHGQGRAFPESYKSNQNSCLPSEGTCSQSVRRIIRSQEIGVNLFGTLKVNYICFLKATLNDKGLVLVAIEKEFLAQKVNWWNLLHAYFCLSLPFLF